ncbi:LUD domain-containing protein [Halarchaeum nitratireducens]|uniref:Lactate utilization protein C n=1 Tax=Halarchaeum nitratireducens TaxID=489913 RepID=A0A830G8H9_9EURY|nr:MULTISPECIES: LUD domain-containing protein [Halarchaeum]MBP2249856.1 L-lactate dehydrogenase complex protein LldG [Halarchaeum solikamskense]GGN10108.1 lactate utilization protein C [Halarchaeum nitratireducens]
MTVRDLRRFESSLDAAGVAATRVDAADVADALDRLVETPAVGVPLGIDGVSLDETVVDLPPTPRLLKTARTGVTPVAAGVVEHGTFVLRSDADGTEPVSLYPPTHVGVLRASDLHADFTAAFDRLDGTLAEGGSAILATGASATADMGELVHGVHGPRTVHAVIVEDR